ncbi:NADPH-dependent reductase BacG [bioreactor metagenome]|uniref:NADPH-dependent reductase BacG n=1 Tax=bioreactor metagenome TaxID=1076179 RepID=A0A644Z475_9ZZZZ
MIFSRTEQVLREKTRTLSDAHGVQADYFCGDIASESDLGGLVQKCKDLGGVDIIILNTPRPPSPMRDFLDESDNARWEQAYEQQLKGALLALRKTAPMLVGRGWGRIVAITSASIKQPMPRHAISTIFRAGVQAALKHLSMELAEHHITVNAVAPATVETPTFAKFHNYEQRVNAVPLKRAGKPEELAATVAFLASNHAGFITGESIQLDGGQTRALC